MNQNPHQPSDSASTSACAALASASTTNDLTWQQRLAVAEALDLLAPDLSVLTVEPDGRDRRNGAELLTAALEHLGRAVAEAPSIQETVRCGHAALLVRRALTTLPSQVAEP